MRLKTEFIGQVFIDCRESGCHMTATDYSPFTSLTRLLNNFWVPARHQLPGNRPQSAVESYAWPPCRYTNSNSIIVYLNAPLIRCALLRLSRAFEYVPVYDMRGPFIYRTRGIILSVHHVVMFQRTCQRRINHQLPSGIMFRRVRNGQPWLHKYTLGKCKTTSGYPIGDKTIIDQHLEHVVFVSLMPPEGEW